MDGESDGCLWALSPARMNSQMGRDRGLLSPEDMVVRMIVAIAFQSDPSVAARQTEVVSASGPTCPKALAINMREIDARVFAQQAACTIHLDASDLSEIDCTSGAWKSAFRIPKDAKPKLRDLLRNLGISKSLLFPDLHSLADDLKSR
jgi:hypothetical protein